MRTFALLASLLTPVAAQLPPPNEAGVAMGHLHLRVPDPALARTFWVEVMGAAPVKLGSAEVLKLPDVLVMLAKGEPGGGTEGSVVNHLGFRVPDLDAFISKAKAAGVKLTNVNQDTRQVFIYTPEQAKIELTEDKSMRVPMAHHHVHFYNESVDESKAWYVKTFGAIPGRRGRFEAADVPGANLSFSPSKTKTAGSKGRAVDHIGFEVKNLEAFVKKLEAAGLKMDVPYRKVPSLGIAIAFLTDPWGAYIELTEGMDQVK
jgi:catechol 2,3-dioxygenase-like lactoylglutathione lyase family enzyme